MSKSEDRVDTAVPLLFAKPVDLDTAARGVGRGSGVYAWWAAPTVFPDLPGWSHENDPLLRVLYVGRATSLRGRILRNHLKRSGSSTLRRTLAGLLFASEGYQTTWTDRVVLQPDDELRLTGWMRAHLRLTWAEHPNPEDIESDLIRHLRPPLNVHGVDPAHLQTSVVDAKNAYNTSAGPPPI